MTTRLRSKVISFAIAGALVAHPAFAGEDGNAKDEQPGAMTDEMERVQRAAEVLQVATTGEDAAIPEALLRKAWGIAVVPHVVKAAVGLGGRFGKGLVARRTADGAWSAPAFISLGGASYGLQIGVDATDLILVFTERTGLEALLGDHLKLGADVGVTAGPIGRKAEAGTNLTLDAAIYSYSRSKGLFAGVALDGAVVEIDDEANATVYGKDVTAGQLLSGSVRPNDTVGGFVKALSRHVPKREA